jgi:hypothetical protein
MSRFRLNNFCGASSPQLIKGVRVTRKTGGNVNVAHALLGKASALMLGLSAVSAPAGADYARITYGYGNMPAWEDVFTDAERVAITAYLKSPNFSN